MLAEQHAAKLDEPVRRISERANDRLALRDLSRQRELDETNYLADSAQQSVRLGHHRGLRLREVVYRSAPAERRSQSPR